jgi:hypothetical protein
MLLVEALGLFQQAARLLVVVVLGVITRMIKELAFLLGAS